MLREFDSSNKADLALANAVSAALNELIGQNGSAVLAVSGGRSPIGFFRILSECELAWDRVLIGLVDERIVELSSEDSNTKLLKTHLLQNRASAARFIPILSDANLCEDALLDYANSHFKQPDIVILGMGEDGHTASLFADAPQFQNAIKTTENIVLTTPKNAPYKRLSLSFEAIFKAKFVFLSISGESKKSVFDKASLKADENLPISLILTSKRIECETYYSK